MCFAVLFMAAGLGSSADLAAAVHGTLAGGASNAAVIQRELLRTLELGAVSDAGVVVRGAAAEAEDLDAAALHKEVGAAVPVLHYVAVSGRGPAPLRVHAPVPEGAGTVGVFQRVEAGLFLRIEAQPIRGWKHVSFEAGAPGKFVIREEDEYSHVDPKSLGIFPEYPPPSNDPALRKHWRLFRVAQEEAAGPIPLLMIHGAGTDRWGEFTDWVRRSPEAAEVRAHYQLWNFSHNMYGINAPIGLDPDCPEFEESIIAYLRRFLERAKTEGVVSGGIRYFFPEGPLAIITNSHGGLKARAFMIHYPDYGEQVLGVITLGAPHLGTPFATPEWLRYTASRLGLLKPNFVERLADEAIVSNYISDQAQSDLDMGWANYDREGGFGIPHAAFIAWSSERGRERRVLSPRDANHTGARAWPGFEDDATFEPAELLDTYCGGLDHIMPAFRGDKYSDRLILYASYIQPARGWLRFLAYAGSGLQSREDSLFESFSLRLTHFLMGFTPSAGGGWPMSPYQMGDGFVPLQSQLLLDGKETRPVFETFDLLGWRVPVLPLRPDMEVVCEHTLADPDKVRILPGWSHLETVTGRYNRETLHSPLFILVGEDLLALVPPPS